jgi:hypothetical protein
MVPLDAFGGGAAELLTIVDARAFQRRRAGALRPLPGERRTFTRGNERHSARDTRLRSRAHEDLRIWVGRARACCFRAAEASGTGPIRAEARARRRLRLDAAPARRGREPEHRGLRRLLRARQRARGLGPTASRSPMRRCAPAARSTCRMCGVRRLLAARGAPTPTLPTCSRAWSRRPRRGSGAAAASFRGWPPQNAHCAPSWLTSSGFSASDSASMQPVHSPPEHTSRPSTQLTTPPCSSR